MHPRRKAAVFLDRDGTINEEVEYLDDPARLRLLPDAAEGISLLNRAELCVVVVTNQAGVGRGYFSREIVESIHEHLVGLLGANGAQLNGVYYCPHHPDDGCPCRKPKPGLLDRAARDHSINLSGSFLVGDKRSDLDAARAAGCRPILVRTGYGAETLDRLCEGDARPDHVADDLLRAARWIVEHHEAR